MKAYDLIHNGYYLLGETEIVRFHALNGGFYTLDGKWVGRVFVDAMNGEIEVLVAEYEWKTITPIPLTPEIMEKNVFIYRDLPFELYWEYNGLFIEVGAYDYYYINLGHNRSMNVSNVHELQGALYLCGLTDLADNFKV